MITGPLGEQGQLLAAAHAPCAEVEGAAGRLTLAVPLENVHGFGPLAEALRAALTGVEIAAEGIGAVTVVGTGVSATPRVRDELRAAVGALGGAALAFEAGPLEVTVYAEARLLPELAREAHRRLLGPS